VSDDLSIPSGPTYRIQRRGGMDPATKRLALIAGGLAGALVVLVGVWSAMGHRHTAVPVIQADSRPMRVKPDNPGGMQLSGGDDVLGSTTEQQTGKLAPAPETPDPQGLKAQLQANAAPPPAATPAPVVTPAAPPPMAASKPIASKPMTAPTTSAPTVAADDKHAAPVATPGHSTPSGKNFAVQLAAVSSEAAAQTEWQRLTHRMPDLMDGRHLVVTKLERDGHTYWRVRTTGFSDMAQASQFCARVKSKGGDCSVAAF
jgi:SPOR domain